MHLSGKFKKKKKYKEFTLLKYQTIIRVLVTW
uniref:Uncharacterized protein n=1 Tax=Rhizophora mucronata TaxID=61149 RepID=A0A2P2PKK4_RHIMU